MYKYTRKEIVNMWGDGIPTSIENDLLAKESREEYSQRIMMEQVKQEDKKEFTHKELSTPSPLDSIEELEEINMATYQGKRDTAIEIMVENKLNELIRNQTKIINYLKGKK